MAGTGGVIVGLKWALSPNDRTQRSRWDRVGLNDPRKPWRNINIASGEILNPTSREAYMFEYR